eukprot:g8603.t1
MNPVISTDSRGEADGEKTNLKERIVSIGGFLLIYCTVTLLAILGYVKSAADVVSSWGVYAHLLSVVYFVFVSVPFGYGYSIGLVAFGYSLGWIALISIVVGVYLGTFLAYLLTKYCLKAWSKRKVEMLLKKIDITLNQFVDIANGNRYRKYLLLFALRHFSLFTFGIGNSAHCLAVLNIGDGIREYCALAYTTDLPYLIAYVSLGISVKQLETGELDDAGTSDNIRLIMLVIQILCTVLIFLVTCYIAHRGFQIIKMKSREVSPCIEDKNLEPGIDGNKISDEGGKAIAEALKVDT